MLIKDTLNMEEKKKRGCNYTAAEKDMLLEIIKKYQLILENNETTAHMILKKRETWNSVCQQYNAVALSGCRSWQQLRHLYENLKQRSKKLTNINTKTIVTTDNTPSTIADNQVTRENTTNIAQASTSISSGQVKHKKKMNIKEQYFQTKLRNAKLETKYLINKNKMEKNKYKIEMQILKLKLNILNALK